MSSQEQSQRRSVSQEEAPDATTPTTSADDRNADVDALLDEIDDVLEANAEEFVASFVQKGGQ